MLSCGLRIEFEPQPGCVKDCKQPSKRLAQGSYSRIASRITLEVQMISFTRRLWHLGLAVERESLEWRYGNVLMRLTADVRTLHTCILA